MWLKSDENFIRFDEKSNTYDSLEKLFLFLNNIENDLNFWKWTIFALHSSLYGSLILSLQGTNPARVIQINKVLQKKLDRLYKIKSININDYTQIAKICGGGKLISLREAFKRIQKEKYMKMYVASKYFQANEKHRKSIRWLNDELRNPFAHFSPRGWSINILDLKNIFKPCFEIIEFCLFESGNVSFDKYEIKKFKEILRKLQNHKNLLTNLE